MRLPNHPCEPPRVVGHTKASITSKAAQLHDKRNQMQALASELRNMLDQEQEDTLNGVGDGYTQDILQAHAHFKRIFCQTQAITSEVIDDITTLRKFIGQRQAADDETLEIAKANQICPALYNYFRFLSARSIQQKR